jgi:hypothetical protein
VENKLKIYSKDVILTDLVEENLLYLGRVDDSIISKNKTFRNIKSSDILTKIEYTDVTDCDFIIIVNKIHKNSEISEIIKLSKDNNKKILLFYNDDNDELFNFENSIIFRTSLYKSLKPKNYFSLPAFSNDLKLETDYFIKSYEKKPVIGFCGALTHNLRHRVLSTLKTNDKLTTNFVVRNSFWGGSIWGDKVREEYIQNTINSDFVICVRGAGNFSYRLYETMCLGRIPIIIDTDIDLPFEDYINYNNFILKININDLDNIENIVINYWNNISDYTELQKNIVFFWESHLSPLGFIDTLNKYKHEISNVLY